MIDFTTKEFSEDAKQRLEELADAAAERQKNFHRQETEEGSVYKVVREACDVPASVFVRQRVEADILEILYFRRRSLRGAAPSHQFFIGKIEPKKLYSTDDTQDQHERNVEGIPAPLPR